MNNQTDNPGHAESDLKKADFEADVSKEAGL